jgi:hypothetical protein
VRVGHARLERKSGNARATGWKFFIVPLYRSDGAGVARNPQIETRASDETASELEYRPRFDVRASGVSIFEAVAGLTF